MCSAIRTRIVVSGPASRLCARSRVASSSNSGWISAAFRTPDGAVTRNPSPRSSTRQAAQSIRLRSTDSRSIVRSAARTVSNAGSPRPAERSMSTASTARYDNSHSMLLLLTTGHTLPGALHLTPLS